jgi:hypothetical protein
VLQFGYKTKTNHYKKGGYNVSENNGNDKLIYKGLPLIRSGNIIYYGNMSDKYIVMIQILSTKLVKDLNVATKVSVQLQLTDSSVSPKDRIVRRSEKEGIYDALDLASIWLARAMNAN